MTRNDRPRKTLARKLHDLNDHLHFLRESLAKLIAGDDAYLKPLAAELRVLVCKSSGTEGLLWRLIGELNLSDTVHVHLAGNLDREHPLARDLQFIFAPVFRAGHGDPGLAPGHYSLKDIIKECEALIVSGKGYTHESLIRAVAEQMGSAHEDEGAAPQLIELSGTLMSNQPALARVLSSDAELVLEIGDKALSQVEGKHGFVRRRRESTATGSQSQDLTRRSQADDFEGLLRPSPPEGTVMFLIGHQHVDWRENSNTYDFGVFAQGNLRVTIIKYPDRTMEVCVNGISNTSFETRKVIPKTEQPGIMVGITWNSAEVIFYLCGERVDSVKYRAEG